MPDVESAIIRLYDDSSLTDELTDEPASALLQWGETRLAQMANTITDDTAFEDQFMALRQLLKSASRFTARRHALPAEEQTDYLQKILETAKTLGFMPSYGMVGAYLEQQQALDDVQHIHLLTRFVETGELVPGDSQDVISETGEPPQGDYPVITDTSPDDSWF